MKKITFTIILSILAIVAASAEGLMRYELDVNDFSELKVVEGVNVIYKANADSAGRAVFVAKDKIAVFEFTVNKFKILVTFCADIKILENFRFIIIIAVHCYLICELNINLNISNHTIFVKEKNFFSSHNLPKLFCCFAIHSFIYTPCNNL